MIRTMYRRPGLPTTPADAFREVPATDPLEGAVPTWRIAVEDDPAWLATVEALGFDPTAVEVDVEVVEVSESSRLDEDVVDEVLVEGPPTLALVPPVEDEVDVVECPDCGATGPDPCRPKSNPATGRPLTRQHRRRRELLEREAGRGGLLLLLVVVLVVAAVASGVAATLRTAVDGVVRPVCVVPTASGCEVGP